MASIEDGFRTQLLEVIKDWRNQFADCIEESKQAGEILTKVPSVELSSFFWSSWEGAVLCSKLEQSIEPLKNVGDLFLNEMLKPKNYPRKK
jgi:TetR/AcrR family transcriptional repressor of nem operon